ncbi:MAG: U32 family peptidase [Nitrospinae bacterium]|nr:U32 family peptidase [Nitrospinota bacterium]MBI3815751.1 U32 family peptidase [Nitrospinota bacterium]
MQEAKSSMRKINITVPINSLDELEPLAANGADEFYCGIIPREWLDCYTYAVPMNRRLNERASLSSIDELNRLVKRAHIYSIPVFVTLNAPYYTDSQISYLIELIKKLYGIGVDGLIISDIGLLLSVKELDIDIDINLSSLASIHNHEAASFYRELEVKRIILPRHITIAEIRAIKRRIGGMEYEVFILNDACIYEEGFCNTTHKAGPFCTARWEYNFFKTDYLPWTDKETDRVSGNLEDFREWGWYMNNCGSTYSEKGLPNGACGLCAIYDFYKIGISALKIVGREATLDRKLKSLKMAKMVIGQIKKGGSKGSVCRYAVEMRNTPELCDSGYMCYYRDARTKT